MNSHSVMAQEWDFVGSSEITFICGGKRVILTATYKGGGGGSILFHQASWDPVFLADINPEDSVDLDQLLSGKVRVAFAVRRACTGVAQAHVSYAESHPLAACCCKPAEAAYTGCTLKCAFSHSLYTSLSLQRPGPVLPLEIQDWPVKEGTTGTAWTMQYLKEEQAWERLPEAGVSYSLPEMFGQVRHPDCDCALWVCWQCCGSVQCGSHAASPRV